MGLSCAVRCCQPGVLISANEAKTCPQAAIMRLLAKLFVICFTLHQYITHVWLAVSRQPSLPGDAVITLQHATIGMQKETTPSVTQLYIDCRHANYVDLV